MFRPAFLESAPGEPAGRNRVSPAPINSGPTHEATGETLNETNSCNRALCSARLDQAKAGDISGAGATFPYPIYAKWADAYKQKTGIGLNYQSIGSGGGIKQIKAKTVTFGASDKPLKASELEEAGLLQFPMIMGGVVPVVNLAGIKPGELTLDGPTLASIFLGEITSGTMRR